ncbi:hypothetical protein AVEN_202585-1 [Araneus ventricosus]|uniref:Secreted protein n=1 Tax=Araneus ventricosus TaxID=182803 RepID=A0A4Y2QMM5_ARAVE|nr:hypothetical protein AVEN_202585-1 [Araneus ventricosus]
MIFLDRVLLTVLASAASRPFCAYHLVSHCSEIFMRQAYGPGNVITYQRSPQFQKSDIVHVCFSGKERVVNDSGNTLRLQIWPVFVKKNVNLKAALWHKAHFWHGGSLARSVFSHFFSETSKKLKLEEKF